VNPEICSQISPIWVWQC